MTSDRKIEANRRNALRSTGPRTAAGKARSSRNALWHGLAAAAIDPTMPEDAVRVARAIVGRNADPLAFERALQIAHAELDLRQARSARLAVFDDYAAAVVNSNAQTALSSIDKAIKQLVALQRYERRARSRRKRATMNFRRS